MDHTYGGRSVLEIPVVDISDTNPKTATRLADAVADCGFVFVHGGELGFTSGILDDTFALVDLSSTFTWCIS